MSEFRFMYADVTLLLDCYVTVDMDVLTYVYNGPVCILQVSCSGLQHVANDTVLGDFASFYL